MKICKHTPTDGTLYWKYVWLLFMLTLDFIRKSRLCKECQWFNVCKKKIFYEFMYLDLVIQKIEYIVWPGMFTYASTEVWTYILGGNNFYEL